MKASKREQRKNRKRLYIMIGVLASIAVVLSAVGVYLIFNTYHKDDMTYMECMQLAEQCASEKNYTEAVRIYWDAIDMDEQSEQAYLGLGEVYEQMGDTSSAESIYNIGYQRTESEIFHNMLDNLQVFLADDKEKSLVVNDSLLQIISGITFQGAEQRYGEASVDNSDKNACVVTYPNLKASFYYYKTGTESMSSQQLKNLQPDEIRLDDLVVLFSSMEDSIQYDDLVAYHLDGLKTEKDQQLKKYVVRFTLNGCGVVIESDEHGNILSRTAWNRLYPKKSEKDTVKEEHTLRGTVINAQTGEGVENANIEISPATDKSTVAATCISDSRGGYTCEGLAADNYIVRIQAEGYIEEEIEIQVYDGDSDTEQDLTISPTLGSGEIRLVLTWGGSPSDLDSYLFGKSSDGTAVNVCYYNRDNENQSDDIIAELDVDCMRGYGPETTTIYDTQGEYEFLVADYNRTGTMASSGAEVKIYVGDEAPITVSVASDVQDQWSVCKIKDGKVEVINASGDRGWRSGGK